MATAFSLDRQGHDAPSPGAAPAIDEAARARLDITLPRLAIALLPGTPAKRPGQRAYAQGQRRATILAAARSLFDEAGSPGLTVRRLAARSGIAAPTIYRLIGRRGAVVEQALLEGLSTCIEEAPAVAEQYGVNIVSAFVEALWWSATQRPAYARHLIALCARTPGGRRVGSVLRDETIAALTRWLTELCDADQLDPLGGATSVAGAIEAHLRIAFIDWADGGCNTTRLRRDLAFCTGITLTGLVDAAEQARLQDMLAALSA